VDLYIPNEQKTLAVGSRLARGLHHGAIIFLSGDMGVGKSTLMRGILQGLGLRLPKNNSRSSYLHSHDVNGLTVHCLDLYLLSDLDDPRFTTALSRLSEPSAVRIVESPERAHGNLPEPDLHIKFRQGIKGRTLLIESLSERGSMLVRAVNAHH